MNINIHTKTRHDLGHRLRLGSLSRDMIVRGTLARLHENSRSQAGTSAR